MDLQKSISIVFGGDLMLGRLVKNAIEKHGLNYPLGQISLILRKGDVTIVNLECAISDYLFLWSGMPKAFYFGASPSSSQILKDCKIDLVTLANNHILDYDYQGMFDTFINLDPKKYCTPVPEY